MRLLRRTVESFDLTLGVTEDLMEILIESPHARAPVFKIVGEATQAKRVPQRPSLPAEGIQAMDHCNMRGLAGRAQWIVVRAFEAAWNYDMCTLYGHI
ncbi:MAG: hypothetical protein Q9198_008531, partial [Flavoplaca austrocitrina]